MRITKLLSINRDAGQAFFRTGEILFICAWLNFDFALLNMAGADGACLVSDMGVGNCEWRVTWLLNS